MKRETLLLGSWGGLLFTFDQLTKRLAQGYWKERGFLPFHSAFLDLEDKVQFGFAFGIWNDPGSLRNELFRLGLPVLALVLIVVIFVKLREEESSVSYALGAIVAGALSNLLDRFRLGYVVDWFQFHWKDQFYLPSLCVADLSIFLGMVLLLRAGLRQQRR